MRAAPNYGAPLFSSNDEAVAVLRKLTGRVFGTSAIAWGNWLDRNRWVYRASSDDPRLSAPNCSRCNGRGKVEECQKGHGKAVWQRIKCPACQGRGIVAPLAGHAMTAVKKNATANTKKRNNSSKEGKGVRVKEFGDWRGEVLARVRRLIKRADPEAIEEVKWRRRSNRAGVPVWSHDGILCTGETYKDKVKLTFAKGAALADPAGLFNASLEAGTRRAIDIREGDQIDEQAFVALIRAAVALNKSA